MRFFNTKGPMRPDQRCAFAAVAFVATLANAQPDPDAMRPSLVQVVVMERNGEVRRARSGFAISAAGHVVTAAHAVSNEDRIVVVPLETGAELAARVVHLNERADVALLAVNGLEQPPLALAKDGFAQGRLVYSAGAWGEPGQNLLVAQAAGDVPAATAEGAVGRHDEIAAASGRPAVSLVLHNAMIPAAGYGGPLLNECGEVAGVNRGAPDVPNWRLREGKAPESVVYSSAASAIAGLMLPAGIAFTQSDTPCVEARAAAQALAARAQEEAEAAIAEAQAQAQAATLLADEAAQQAEEKDAALEARQRALQAAESRVSELQAQHDDAVRTGAAEAEALQAELDGARAEREAAQTAVSAMEEEIAALRVAHEAQAQANRMRFVIVAVAVALLAVVVAVVVAIALRRRSRALESARQQAARAEQEAEQARQQAESAQAAANAPPPTLADCLLTGSTDDGRPVSVKIPGSLLAGEGAAIGRSPRNATFLIDDETLSREHARVSHDPEAGLRIEDLDSTNGTRLNGRRLPPRTPTRMANEDAVELGGVKLQVVWEG